IKRLKEREFNLTATAIYTELQGFLAIGAGVDYLAPYYNRMENINVDAPTVIESLAQAIRTTQAQSKILAASFKNTTQMNRAIRAGAHALTADPD
ncbi:fructose-bisphosphate aldolase, partial [Enterococcus faecalis]